jgi:hypothetical protein
MPFLLLWHPRATGTPPEPPVTPPGSAGGVKKRPVVLRLSDVNSKEELANFIKSHLHNPVEQEVVPQTVYRSGKKTAKQREEERLADLAMKNMQIEADDELRIEYNNAVLLLLMATYDE